ncbi:MAG: extradiol ring-cleavage dioxygenase [Chloroflexi bacterium]|nr:extradiol ring-cleavage dioxygenase [Chloroflexota bacterium]
MSKLVAGMASSHAFALQEPSSWDEHRLRNRQMYARRYGTLPPEQPGVAEETDDENHRRYERIRDAFGFLRRKLEEMRPDALIFIGDDQNENFTDQVPQIAIYLGEDFLARSRGYDAESARYRCDPKLAATIFAECVESDIDMAGIHALPDNVLMAHAVGPVLRMVDPEARIPVVPIFVNAIHVPAPSPARCYYLGQTIRRALERHAGDGRVAVYGSGGLSHFTGGYPWVHYEGPFSYGSISEEFDRWLVNTMEAGEGHALAGISNPEIIANGEIELRSWITVLGATGDLRPELLVYEPFYRGIMGMGVGYWNVPA